MLTYVSKNISSSLAKQFLYGEGFLPRSEVLFRLYGRRAANLGDPDCAREIAWIYYKGINVKQSYPEAKKYFEIAAQNGDPFSGKILKTNKIFNDTP